MNNNRTGARLVAAALACSTLAFSPTAYAVEAITTPASPLPATPSASPVPSASPAVRPGDDLLEQTEEYKRLKAEIRYPLGDRTGRPEVSIAGLRVGDLQLARAVGDKVLNDRLEGQLFTARLWQGVISGLTIPAGIYLLIQANSRLNASKVVGTTNTNPDFFTFVLGFVGSVATVYGFVNLVPLFNDLAGLDTPTILGAAELTSLVRRYNEALKDQLRRGGGQTPAMPGGAPLVGWSWKF